MKTIMTCLLLLCALMAPLPGQALSPAPDASERAALAALNQPSLLKQSAGERVLVVEEDGGHWHRYRRGYGIGGLVLVTAIIVTVVVLGLTPGPGYRR